MLDRHVCGAVLAALLICAVLYTRHRRTATRPANGKVFVDDHDDRPLLWIYVPFEFNSRMWWSFYSRSSKCLNKPYQLLCMKSVIDHCKEDFDIRIICDSDLPALLESVPDLSTIPEPMLSGVRDCLLCRVLAKFGGILVPPDFVAGSSLKWAWDATPDDRLVCVEGRNASVTSQENPFSLSPKFMACRRHCKAMQQVADAFGELVSTNMTASPIFEGSASSIIASTQPVVIPAEAVGLSTYSGETVTLEDLSGSTEIDFGGPVIGVWLCGRVIASHTAYGWMERMSPAQVLTSNTEMGKILLSFSK